MLLQVAALWAASCGAIDQTGRYTAPAVTVRTTCTITATLNGKTGRATATIIPPSSIVVRGIPYGPYAAWATTTQRKPDTEPFDLDHSGVRSTTILARIDAARANGVRLVLAMTGAHEPYLSVINGVIQFDRSKWNDTMQTFNTPAITAAVAQGVLDGTIVGASVMDEPNVSGGGDGNTWGPKGTMTKLRVDSLCGYVKQIFPTLPAGVVARHDVFEPTKAYRVCDFNASQYVSLAGTVTAFRDAALAMGTRDGHAVLFSMNILGGGIKASLRYPNGDLKTTWDPSDCPLTTTGGRGPYFPLCRMHWTQVRDFGLVLGPAGCGLLMWKYDAAMFGDALYQPVFREVADNLALLTPKACRRP